MKEKLQSVIDNYLKSFNNIDEGWSRKKVIATVVVLSTLIMQVKWVWKTQDFQQLENILIIDYAFASALLGISTIQSIKSNNSNQKETKS